MTAPAGNELCAILPLSRERESALVPERVGSSTILDVAARFLRLWVAYRFFHSLTVAIDGWT